MSSVDTAPTPSNKITVDPHVVDILDRFGKIQNRAAELLALHGLDRIGWRFEFSAGKHQVGLCSYNRKKICFSRHFVESDWKVIEDTLLHEVAHALVGPRQAHNEVWQHQAILLGARPEPCTDPEFTVSTATYNFILTCPGCGRTWRRHRVKAGIRSGRLKSACCKRSLYVETL
jgi:SprT-like family.